LSGVRGALSVALSVQLKQRTTDNGPIHASRPKKIPGQCHNDCRRQLGAEAVFVGSGIFKSSDPEARARAIVKAATYFNDPAKLLEASEDLGIGMAGLDISKIQESELMQTRGW